jgi:hypothetical protein
MPVATISVPAREIRQKLAAARRRFAVQGTLTASARLLLCVALGALVWALANFLRGGAVVDATLIFASAALWLFGTMGLAAFSFRSLPDIAADLDRLAPTRDRFQTGLDFADRSPSGGLRSLAIAECEHYAQHFAVERWIPLGFPRHAWWALAPMATIALLCWHAALVERGSRPDAVAQEKVEGQAKTLEQIAAELAKAAETRGDEDLAKLAKAMQERAARLKERAAKDRDADKLALREISALESILREMQQNAGAPHASLEELAALAEALERTPEGKDAAEALKSGEIAQAGRHFEELLQKLKQRGDAAKQLDELARSMQEKGAKLSAEQKGEIARQMEQAAQAAQAGRSEQVQQLLQRLADLLKQTGKGNTAKSDPAKSGEGKGPPTVRLPLDVKTLQELINALEKLKQSGGADRDAVDAASRALIRIPLPNPDGRRNPSDGKPGAENSDLPGAQKGEENDRGTSDRLFADKAAEARVPEGPARRLEGALGDGSSLQEFMQSAAAGGKSSSAYRELYGVMAPAAQDAVEQENIPLGSRFYIRKYFEAIRPPE